MSIPTADAPAPPVFGDTDRLFRYRYVCVHYRQDSPIARLAGPQAHHADRVRADLISLLQPPIHALGTHRLLDSEAVLSIVWSDLPASEGAKVAPSYQSALYVSPPLLEEETGADRGFTWKISHFLMRRWFGTLAVDSPLARVFVDGIAAHLDAESHTGPSRAENVALVRKAMESGQSLPGMPRQPPPGSAPVPPGSPAGAPSTLPAQPMVNGAAPPRPATAPGDPAFGFSSGSKPGAPPSSAPPRPSSTSSAPPKPTLSDEERERLPAAVGGAFVAYLLDEFGCAALQSFFRSIVEKGGILPAAEAAYGQPLPALQAQWRDVQGAPSAPSIGADAIRQFVRRMFPFLRPHKLRLAELGIYLVFGSLYAQVLAYASSDLIKGIEGFFARPASSRGVDVGQYALHFLIPFTTKLLGLYLLNALVALRSSYTLSVLGQRVTMALQLEMFQRLQKLSLGYFGRSRVGDLQMRLSGNVTTVQMALTQLVSSGTQQVLTALFAATNILYQTIHARVPLLGLCVVALVPFFFVSNLLMRRKIQEVSALQQRIGGQISSQLNENLSAQPTIKAFGMADRAVEGYENSLNKQYSVSRRMNLLSSLSNLSIQMTMSVGQLMVLVVGGWFVLHNPSGADMQKAAGMNLATLVLLQGLLPQLLGSVVGIANLGQGLQMASGSLDRINQLLQEKIDVADASEAPTLAPLAHSIRLENVTFGYDTEKVILRDISLEITAGTRIAIVGKTGNGKSTIIQLLMRYWDPQSGRVLFDDVDLKTVSQESLRSQISIVPQSPFIFADSVFNNISVSRPGATLEQVEAAARAAKFHDWVMEHPDGYYALLTERGGNLSGGLLQRLAIARALLREPKMFVLDEATSALDAHTEAEVLETLDVVTRGRTTVIISHRMAMAATADRIFVLENGMITQQGAPSELRYAGGLYQELYEEQMGLSKDPAPAALPEGHPDARVGLSAAIR